MGIYKFGKWLGDTYKNNPNVYTALPANVGCLFFDLNGVFHSAAQKVFGYQKGDPESDEYKPKKPSDAAMLERKKLKQIARLAEYETLTFREREDVLLQKIVKKIYKIILKIQPSDYVILTVDGVAPMAKITQQRKRRFDTKLTVTEIKEEEVPPAEADLGLPLPSSGKKLKSKEESVLGSKNLKLKEKFDPNCISPGTEFMMRLDNYIQLFISEFIKQNKFRFKFMVYSSHLVPGEGEHKIFDILRNKNIEPDLTKNNIVYGLDSDLVMLTLVSETPNLYLCREKYTDIVSVDGLRKDIYSKMNFHRKVKNSLKITIQDFITFMYLIGNDFLPKTPALKNVKKSVEDMITIYRNMEVPLTDETGQILWKNLLIFVGEMAKLEPRYFKMMSNDPVTYPYTTLDNALYSDENGQTRVDIKKFAKGWYKKCLNPLDPELMKSLGVDFSGQSLNKDSVKDSVREMCLEFFKGMQWCLRYYLKGHKTVSSRFIYIYFYAPLMRDMYKTLAKMDEKDLPTVSDVRYSVDDPYINPIVQLICIMPRKSWRLVPQPYSTIMDVMLGDLYPETVYHDYEGLEEKDKFMKVSIIPIVDPYRIVKAIENFPIPAKYREVYTQYVSVVFNPKPNYKMITTAKQVLDYYSKMEKTGEYISSEKFIEEQTKEKEEEEDFFPELTFNEEIKKMYKGPKLSVKTPHEMERIIKARGSKIAELRKKPKIENFVWTDSELM